MMNSEKTKDLLKSSPVPERSPLVKDIYKGKKCYIISCGPSLRNHDIEALKKHLADELVICIKQSYDDFAEVCDFHVYNCGNYKQYDYSKNPNTVAVECTSYPQYLNKECDLKYFIQERQFHRSLSVTKNFDNWALSNYNNGQVRPYGPGIMYEIVFYFAEHLGVSEIITIGWDNTNTINGKTYDKGVHFYDLDGDHSDYITHNAVSDNPGAVASLPTETSITLDNVIDWYYWLNSKGIKLKIVSEYNPVSKLIPRLKMEDILGEK